MTSNPSVFPVARRVLLATIAVSLLVVSVAHAQAPAMPPAPAQATPPVKKVTVLKYSDYGMAKGPRVEPSPERAALQKNVFDLSRQGCTFFQAGKYEEAQKALEEAHRLLPTVFMDRDELSDIYGRQNRWADALKVYEEHTISSNARDLFHYALILLKNGQKNKAMAMYHGAASQLAEDAMNYPVRLKQFTQDPAYVSDKWLEAAIVTGRGMVNIYFDKQKAVEHFRHAIELYPNFAPANYYLFAELDRTADPALVAEREAARQRVLSAGTPDAQKALQTLQR